LHYDFTHYPPTANVEITHEGCDHSVFAGQKPHLRLLVPEKSRFSMGFSLPEAPEAAFLEVTHLASQGADGKGVSPVTIMANGKPVVEDWNVGQTEFSETRWAIGDKLQAGQNQIEWRAGKLRSHYCDQSHFVFRRQHLTLKTGSKAVDAGTIVPNIADDFVGNAPDLGAYELGGEMPHYGPRSH
jgi:hypothetical protein